MLDHTAEDHNRPQPKSAYAGEIFFHLPTMIAVAIIGVLLTWQLYDLGFTVAPDFIRVHSNRGSVTIHWQNGCCEFTR
ncbi:MAG: hypothetical protein R3264_08075 [Anaerolineae bacterium]|nr:hypothetical protein [Anaerolineae bacterium]